MPIGVIELRYQGSIVGEKALESRDIITLCDIKRQITDKAKAQLSCTRQHSQLGRTGLR
jgi:hypothetical protein